jgi:hypothetical protein
MATVLAPAELVADARAQLAATGAADPQRGRLIGLLAYDTEPGTVSTDLLRLSRYGRTEPLR